jgi:hypothetical protein
MRAGHSFLRRSPLSRSLAAFMAAIVLLQSVPVRGAPGDIFSTPAPVIGVDPPKAHDINAGEAAVSS